MPSNIKVKTLCDKKFGIDIWEVVVETGSPYICGEHFYFAGKNAEEEAKQRAKEIEDSVTNM